MISSKRLICFLVAMVTISFSSKAFAYGYGTAGEDPLITMFKEIVVEAKKKDKDWTRINEIVTGSEQNISNLDNYFGLNLSNKFNNSLNDKDLKMLIGVTVNLIYLSMMEKFDLIIKKEFKDYDFSRGRLALNDKYYRDIFSGNVKKYDAKNGTNLNDQVLKDLKNIQGTIGKPGKFGMEGDPAHPDDFIRLFENIKKNLKTVFPYFEG